ncbi:hypothetical protein WJ968_16660 [Achromobacter xylosoxidans]
MRAQLALEHVARAHRLHLREVDLVQADAGFDDAGGDHRTQFRHEDQRDLLAQIASLHFDMALAGRGGRRQRQFGLAAFHEDLRAGLGGRQIFELPLADRGVQRHLGAGRHGHAVAVRQAQAQSGRRAAVGHGALGRAQFDAGQLAGRDHADGRAAARVAHAVQLFDLDAVDAGAQVHAHVFPALHALVLQLALLADAILADFGAVDLEAEDGPQTALDHDGSLGDGQGLAFLQVEQAQFGVGLGQQFLQR